MIFKKTLIFLLSMLVVLPLFPAKNDPPICPDPNVTESFSKITAYSCAPVPKEVSNETQARAISREASVSLGQEAILKKILSKKTHSGKTLAEAEVPSLDLQKKVRDTIKGSIVKKTQWKDGLCWTLIELPKSRVKTLLKKNK
ncbi:MAG: hypothetical protein ACKVQC_01275 [Elusimicrobiota bacterium]